MRRLLVLLALILVPAAAGAADFDCREQAFDLTPIDATTCPDPLDLSTCVVLCTRPELAADPARCFAIPVTCTNQVDPATCAPVAAAMPLELQPVPGATRTGIDKPLLRRVEVRSGPSADVILSKVALNEIADGRFMAARKQLCVPPPPPPPPSPTPGSTPPPTSGGPGTIGGDPGLDRRESRNHRRQPGDRGRESGVSLARWCFAVDRRLPGGRGARLC